MKNCTIVINRGTQWERERPGVEVGEMPGSMELYHKILIMIIITKLVEQKINVRDKYLYLKKKKEADRWCVGGAVTVSTADSGPK